MIPCAVFKCHHPATHGAIYRHESNGTIQPTYYYCDQHAEARRIDALDMWKVTNAPACTCNAGDAAEFAAQHATLCPRFAYPRVFPPGRR